MPYVALLFMMVCQEIATAPCKTVREAMRQNFSLTEVLTGGGKEAIPIFEIREERGTFQQMSRRLDGAAVKQYLLTDRAALLPTWTLGHRLQACRSSVSAVVVDAFVNNAG